MPLLFMAQGGGIGGLTAFALLVWSCAFLFMPLFWGAGANLRYIVLAWAAATATTKAGAYTPFTFNLGRPDGNQTLSLLTANLPMGETARIRDVEQCTDAQIAAVACPAGSQIGTVTTRTGAGSSPLTLTGKLYFTGPYKGGPFGTVAVIRAVAGPYDLGHVVVRQSLRLAADTARVSIVSDALPQIVEGIPLRLRDLAGVHAQPDVVLHRDARGEHPGGPGRRGLSERQPAVGGLRQAEVHPEAQARVP